MKGLEQILEIKPNNQPRTYKCLICKDNKMIETNEDDYEFSEFKNDNTIYYKKCSCVKKIEFENKLINAGMSNIIEKIKNEEYIQKYDWQKELHSRLKMFVVNEDKSFIISGQTGSGKTLLMGKMLYNFIHIGRDCFYLDWHNDYKGKLVDRYNVVDEKLLQKIIDVDVLYIDDLFKVSDNELNELKNKNQEIMIFRQIIDKRISNKNKKTMISTELFYKDFDYLDNSLAGRMLEIVQKKDNWIQMNAKEDRNIRVKKFNGEF